MEYKTRKGKLTKKQQFLSGDMPVCQHHGQHNEWTIHNGGRGRMIVCKRCRRDYSKKRLSNPAQRLFDWSKTRANKRGVYFDLLKEDIDRLFISQENKCAISGIEFTSNDYCPSLDRIDSSKGYSCDNIQLVCSCINRMKSNMIQDHFVNLCAAIADYKRKCG